MKRLLTLNAALVATLAVGLAISASASAEEGGNPLILPEPSEAKPLKFTSSTGTFTLHIDGIPLKCLSGSSSGEFVSKRLGKITITFTACEALSPPITCHSAGDAKGVILFAAADLHLVAYKVSGTLAAALVIKLPGTIKIECNFGTFEWKGSVFAPLTGVSSKTSTAKFSFGEGECELDKEFCLEGSVHRKFKLESVGGSEAGVTREDTVTFGESVTFDF